MSCVRGVRSSCHKRALVATLLLGATLIILIYSHEIVVDSSTTKNAHPNPAVERFRLHGHDTAMISVVPTTSLC